MNVSDPEAFQLLADSTRRKIIYLLRVKEMTVNKLAQELDLTPQTVYFHVKKLLKGEMVEVVRERRVGHLMESYYRATAETFSFVMGKSEGGSRSRKMAIEQERGVLDALVKMGYKLKYDDQAVSRLVDIMEEEKAGSYDELNKKVEALGLDPVTSIIVADHAWALGAKESEFNKADEAKHKFREFLLSLRS